LLEDRSIPSTNVSLNGGVLTAVGDSHPELLVFTQVGSTVEVTQFDYLNQLMVRRGA
jgi:hypothetical protein